MVEKNERRLSASFEENIRYMNEVLPVKESFDIIRRDMKIGGKASVFYYIDGFVKDEAMLKIMDSFLSVSEQDMSEDAESFIQEHVPYVEVDLAADFDQVLRNVLSGAAALFIDGYVESVIIDCRTYPARSVDEPEKDKSLRGSRDGFVETIVFNTALMRRRIRDPHLIMEMTEAGQSSQTDIAICYMSDRVDQELLDNLRRRISELNLDDLRMNQQSLAEALFKRKWFNPFPKFKYTERPDTAAACLLEGKVVVLVDNAPSAMILPTSILDMIEEANDYYFPTLTGIYLKVTGRLLPSPRYFLLRYTCSLCRIPVASRGICVCRSAGYGQHPADLSVPSPGTVHRRPSPGSHEYADHAQHAAQCDRRYRNGRILRTIRLVQQ